MLSSGVSLSLSSSFSVSFPAFMFSMSSSTYSIQGCSNSIPAVIWREVGYIVVRLPVFHRASTKKMTTAHWFLTVGVARENLCRHGENMQTPHTGFESSQLVESRPGFSCCEVTVLTGVILVKC